MPNSIADIVAGTETLSVEGMTCCHCVHAVTREIGSIPGVHSVEVELATGRVTLNTAAPIRREDVARAVTEAGYTLSA